MSFRHETINGTPFVIVDVRTVDGAKEDGYMQILLNGNFDMHASDFIL